jgi:hypothetical protein
MRRDWIFFSSALFLAVATAAAQVPDVGSIHCIGNCGSSGGSAPSVRSSPGSSVPSGPSPEELERQRKQQAGYDQDVLGVDCSNKGDWDCAIRYFQAALENRPGDPVITQNLRNALESQKIDAAIRKMDADAREAAARAQREAVASGEMRLSIDRLTDALNQGRAGTDFDGSGGSTGASPGLTFMGSTPAGGSAARDKVPKTGCGPETDPSVVNLCNAGTGTVDPRRVKGAPAAPSEEPLQFATSNSSIQGTGIPSPSHLDVPSSGAAVDMRAFAYPSPAEKARAARLQSISQDAHNQLQMAIDADRRGDHQAAREAIQRTKDAIAEALPLMHELDAVEQDRMKAGMKVLLQDPVYAAAWNASVARIRQEEKAEFARADAQRQKMMDQIAQGHMDQAAAQKSQALSDQLREAQVEAMQQATRKLKAEAQRLLKQASEAPVSQTSGP